MRTQLSRICYIALVSLGCDELRTMLITIGFDNHACNETICTCINIHSCTSNQKGYGTRFVGERVVVVEPERQHKLTSKRSILRP